MDRRFFTWLMLTTALCFLYLSMRQQVAEKKLPEARQPAAPHADPLLRDAGDAPPEPPAAELNDGQDADVDLLHAAAPSRPEFPAQLITLGSMDPTQGYNLLVALTTRGGGVERAELVGRNQSGRLKYRALEHEGGYLGYLGLAEAVGGLRIRCVPDGSAAAAATSPNAPAGLLVGDIITDVSGMSASTVLAMEETLRQFKPGEKVKVSVRRSVGGVDESLQYTATLSEAPLDIVRMRGWQSEEVVGNLSRPSLLTTLASINSTKIPVDKDALPALRATLELDWAVEPLDVKGGQGVAFRLPLDSFLADTGRPSKLDIVKRYRLLPAGNVSDGYILDFETVIVNRNDEPVDLSIRQEGLNGLSLEGWWYSVKISPQMFAGAGNRDVTYLERKATTQKISTTRQIFDKAKKTPTQPNVKLFSENEPLETRTLKYIGADAQYFNASLLPHPDAPESLSNLRQAEAGVLADVQVLKKSQIQAANVMFRFDTNEQSVAPAGELVQRYEVFLGPKDASVLADHGLQLAIEYGWFPWIAKPLGWILHFFYGIFRNYGLAIVLLTVMVRAAMFPLGRKAAMNAQRMQELQPELKRINDLYKDNMEKRAKAMQELYAKHNFKPLAGCLPMFIQLPIFIGLYRCLSVDISLRQQPLIPGLDWCSNLSAPDQLISWSSWMPEFFAGRGTGWLGPYFNILPMVTVGLFLLQQKMLMPKATDDQTRMTQNMMQVMTIFMGVLFFKVPSGLCLYFVTSSLWSLVERKLVKRLTPASKPLGEAGSPATGKEPASPEAAKPNLTAREKRNRRAAGGDDNAPQATGGRLHEFVKMLEKPAVKSATQRGSSKPPKGTRKDKKRKR